MTRGPIYAPAADADLRSIAEHIARDNPRRAYSFVRELRLHCRRLAQQPRIHRLRDEFGPGVRVAVHGSYLILYAERDGAVVVERILHGARDLGGMEF